MSKKCKKETAKLVNRSVKNSDLEKNEKNHTYETALDTVVGTSNVNKWNQLKEAFCCKTNVEFVMVLLNLAEEQLNNRKTNDTLNTQSQPLSNQNEEKDYQEETKINREIADKNKKSPPKKVNTSSKLESELNLYKQNEVSENFNVYDLNSLSNSGGSENLVDKNNILMQQLFSDIKSPVKEEFEDIKMVEIDNTLKENKVVKNRKNKIAASNLGKIVKKGKCIEVDNKKKIDHDIRKAPELTIQVENNVQMQNSELKITDDSETNDKKRVAIKIKLCSVCNTHHLQDHCSLQSPQYHISDSLTFLGWQKRYKSLLDEKPYSDSLQDADSPESNIKLSYAVMSLPSILYMKENNNGWCVFAKEEIKSHAQFGPLIGKTVREVDIPEDSGMKDYWEVQSEKYHGFVCTENLEESNWMRFVRPASTREERNITVVCKKDELYFVTIKNLQMGDELLYWQDSSVVSNKKKMEKTTCGGCNMTFSHPLYYRLHCSVFHDVRYSLTIRKYHCKICGVAVLGKENIMKHAAELHNGQGAYQCQFCKKFFLRLNYLEMHRTYGCSANPHRSRPLCDFCGRKFCQPQKLKVHIKRMHSEDMSVVLKEFQCKNCLKILGSRAALQRHVKEVHQKQVEGACTCSRCGKLFQNKSNLKIHMLTHSGIKPFKCAQKECNAAFTTKQCLQFHYKKVHGFTENEMPKIERSVDYTFEAYSGLEDGEVQNKSMEKMPEYSLQNGELAVEDSSDVDSASVDERNMDDPPPLQSPGPIPNDLSNSNTSPAVLEPYNAPTNLETNTKVLSKGSKKWIGDQVFPTQNQINRVEDTSNSIEVDECHNYESAKLSTTFSGFNRHESNASLLVEAALDSVCSESNIDMDVTTVPSSTDTLVNNLYTLAHPDTLPDVTYNNSVNESRDINLISPSVNDQISVTDDLNDDLRHNQNINSDYSAFHQEDFSPAESPTLQHKNNFVGDYISTVSPDGIENYETDRSKNVSPISSPPRYDFNPPANVEHMSSDDSNGVGVQNLSLHNSKNDMQLDLSIYKSPYFRMKFDGEVERSKQVYVLEMNDDGKNYGDENLIGQQSDLGDGLQNDDAKQKEVGLERYKYGGGDQNVDLRSKFELDLDLRIKSYENIESELRGRNYEGICDANDFRVKNYEVDGLDTRNKTYDGLIETDFRAERGLEPLLLNPTEIQGLDMSARNYHNYSNLNRYHHLYSDVDRPSVDLRLNYSPPQHSYTHADILRVVSLDLTPPGRHSVDLSLRSHSLHQIANSRLLSEHALQTNSHRLLDQTRLLNTDLNSTRHLGETRILSDHTTNRLLSNDQILTNRLISEESRLLPDQTRLLDQSRLIGEGRLISGTGTSSAVSPPPVQYSGYPVSPSPYHPTPLPPRPHATSPTPSNYHHYSYY